MAYLLSFVCASGPFFRIDWPAVCYLAGLADWARFLPLVRRESFLATAATSKSRSLSESYGWRVRYRIASLRDYIEKSSLIIPSLVTLLISDGLVVLMLRLTTLFECFTVSRRFAI